MLKTYQATFKEDTDGVFSISLVNDPATQELFIALSSQEKIQLAEVDKEQRVLMGLVLQPDQLIYRKNEKTLEEFNIVFNSETIKELSHNFFKSGFQLNSKLEHEEVIKGVTIVESWLVENPKVDKSTNFGMEYPKGSWMATMKIDNDDIWNKYVKTGSVQGFSIDAMVDLKEVNLKSNIEMAEEKKSFKEQVNEVLVSVGLMKEIKLGSVMSGDVNIEYDGDVLEVGTPVFVVQGEERIPLPDNDYPTEMGLVVVKDGLVVSVGEAEVVEEAAVEPTASAPSNDELTQAIKSLLIKYSEENDAKLKEVTDSIVEFKTQNETLKAEVLELSKEPATKPITSAPVQVEYSKMSNYQKLKHNRGEL